MMKLKYLFENFELARLALVHYPHDEDTLEECLRWFRISANAVYPYRCEGKLCFLRLAPTEEKQLPFVQSEVEYIRYLRGCGYPAMKPIGDAWLLESPWGNWCVSCFEGVKGKPAEDCQPDPNLFFAMGEALGRLHKLSKSYQPAIRRSAHDEVLRKAAQSLRNDGAPPAVLDALNALQTGLNRLPVTQDHYGLLHYDFEMDNVFWDGCECSVIDFDDAMYGWFSLDVEKALESVKETGEDKAEEVFMAGYRSVSPFTDEMESQRPLMRRMIHLYSYARLAHCLHDEVSRMPEWMQELRQRLSDRMHQLEQWILQE